MDFQQTPPPFSPALKEAYYILADEQNRKTDLIVTFLNATSHFAIGQQEHRNIRNLRLNVAPYVRGLFDFQIEQSPTGVYPASKRKVDVEVLCEQTIYPPLSNATPPPIHQQISHTSSYILAEHRPESLPAILTTMPKERLIGKRERDELTILTEEPLQIVMTILLDDGTVQAQNYPIQDTGIHLFRLNMEEFPSAKEVTIDCGTKDSVHYCVVNLPTQAVRIAWQSREGSIEHYTFPQIASHNLCFSGHKIRTEQGNKNLGKGIHHLVLRSAYESQPILEALAESIVAEKVWKVTPQGYLPIEVTTDHIKTHLNGTLSCIDLDIIEP